MWMLHCRKIKKIRGDLSKVDLHQSNMIRSDLSHLLLVRGLRDVSMSLRGLTVSSPWCQTVSITVRSDLASLVHQ